MYHDCKNRKVDNLDATISKIRAIHHEKVDEKHSKFDDLINTNEIET
jgi:hypothetical protein